MPPPDEPSGAGDISVTSPQVFKTFTDRTGISNSTFTGQTAGSRELPAPGNGELTNSQALGEQLSQAATLRGRFIDATSTGLTRYQSTSQALYSLHVQLGSVTTATMRQIVKIDTPAEGGD
ncbi:hypothetical protein AB0F43_10435 [Kribbella sp. NPDC023972]|uniref:hypothetical protein n=1 Tax=Kribbella sp. NPDC023972 TaxID=3154795 RepID=UPI0033EC098D